MSPSKNTPLLPEGALPCVWMTAGLVAFKLCDREFDCENCPLDRALGEGGRDAEIRHSGLETAADWGFPPDRRYHPGHGWVRDLGNDRIRFGVDALAARLLDHLSAVVLPPVRSRIRRDRPACWLADEGELFPFRAPVSGVVLQVNARLQQEPGLLAESPYEQGWILDLESARGLDGAAGLLSAEAMRRQTAKQLKGLQGQVSRHRAGEPVVGATLADGGERLTGLRGILGTPRYHRLLLHLLA